MDAAELALLARPTHTLSHDEKAHRRRLQYKYHQRKHRAQQHERTAALAHDVRVLAQHIRRLEARLHDAQHTHARATVQVPRLPVTAVRVVAPAQVAMEYLRQFEFGLRHDRVATQEQFLRATMVANVGGPDYQGIDELLDQWRLYGQFFHRTQYIADGVEIASMDDMTVVCVRVVLEIRARRDGVLCLCPRLRHDEEAIQAMVGSPIRVPGRLRFVFNAADGACSWFGADMDFVAGLQRVLGDLRKVALCMDDAKLSFSTGQILPGCQDELEDRRGVNVSPSLWV